jgi:anti-sigma factor RsiW
MKCSTAQMRINEHVDGVLDPEQEAELKVHLDICPECRKLAQDLAAIVRTARGLPSLEPSAMSGRKSPPE